MNVLQVSHRYPPAIGGVENYAQRLTDSLRGSDHDVSVLTTDLSLDGGTDAATREEARYCSTTATISRNPVSIDLYRAIRRTSADVCHLHSPYLLTSLEAAHGLPADTASVVTVHGFPAYHDLASTLRNHIYRPFAQYVYDAVDGVFVLGPSERDRLLDRYDVDPAKVRVVPNGIEPDDCDVPESAVRKFRREHGLDPSTPTVLFVGRLVPWKNPGVLVESITTHLSDLDLDVVVVGEGEQEFVDDLKRRADERFTFIPGLPWRDLLPAYFASDVFVILSKSEGLSTVVLEAMNGRLPIVTTPVGALDDVVTNEAHGLTVEQPPSPNAVADALRHYCENPDERRRVGQRNREYVRESYAWADVADRIEETYEELRDAD